MWVLHIWKDIQILFSLIGFTTFLSIPCFFSSGICTYRSLSLCLLRALGSKNRDGDPDGASCLEDEAAHKHYQQQKQDVSSRKQCKVCVARFSRRQKMRFVYFDGLELWNRDGCQKIFR
uniref:Uncharacterized protein n=1 Tax=Oryza rufipogon TaxID=4529 RepID=A0A0E0NEM7_ORYRU